ncbi:hypothetical protein [Sandarakinorhabdus sp. AAP62]|uniref:hypothetical protein n=1 Tax=Sandarakinorhabdus sp. AAP62 TaxID=1248916 RepID=UPI00036D5893|nr:hypothetical protein [Sandarakinorhabdus sp. AAP62]
MHNIKALASMPAKGTHVFTMLSLLALAACSTGMRPPPQAAAPPTQVTAVVPTAPTRIVPDAVAASAEVVWALRGGLNVAALICQNRALAADYNQILKTHRNVLNEAYAAEQARYRQQHGSAGLARHDVAMTRLYNGFASVPDRRRFCTQASRVADELLTLPSADVPRIAARALTTMEPGAMRLVNSAY